MRPGLSTDSTGCDYFSVDGDGNSVSESAPNRAMGFHILNQTIYGVRIAIRVQVDC